MDIVKASQILDVESKVLRAFDVLDVYNPPNTLQGYLCMQSDDKYEYGKKGIDNFLKWFDKKYGLEEK